MDISNGLNQIFNLFFNFLTYCFTLLDSIHFFGISLLDFMIWSFVISVSLPVVVTLVKRGRSLNSRSEHRRNKGDN